MKKARRFAILGFGVEGKSVLRFLGRHSEFNSGEIWILDKNPRLKHIQNAKPRLRLRYQLGSRYLDALSRFDTLFRSPGVPLTTPELVRAKRAGVTISSATKLFFEELAALGAERPRVIGVTGSKGKSTTASLIAHLLQTSGFRVALAGNIGTPMLDLVPKLPKLDYVVLELSSFQLADLDRSPQIAVILDIFPEHLDYHKHVAEYLAAKKNIAAHQGHNDAVFYFKSNRWSTMLAHSSLGKKVAVFPRTNTPEKNIVMATNVAQALGCSRGDIQEALHSFKSLPHRLELVRTMRTKHGSLPYTLRFLDDSAATNPEATAAALRSIAGATILIAGGKNKNLSYTPLITALRQTRRVTALMLFGENSRVLERTIRKARLPRLRVERARNLRAAVARAYAAATEAAAQTATKQVTILFSPGAASFDMFDNYAARGEAYKKAVHALN